MVKSNVFSPILLHSQLFSLKTTSFSCYLKRFLKIALITLDNVPIPVLFHKSINHAYRIPIMKDEVITHFHYSPIPVSYAKVWY